MSAILDTALASYKAIKAHVNAVAPLRPEGAPRAAWMAENKPDVKTSWLVSAPEKKRLQLVLNAGTSPRMYVMTTNAKPRIIRNLDLKSSEDRAWLAALTEVKIPMDGAAIEAAKVKLGRAWGLDRPLHNSELARALRLGGRDPGRAVQDWLKGESNISGPASVALEMMLSGPLPPDPLSAILR